MSMKWFGRKAVRRSGRPFLLTPWGGTRFGSELWPRAYEAQARDAYLGNPVAQRAVRLVAECVAWAPVYEAGVVGKEEAPPHSFDGRPPWRRRGRNW
jgi:hypothetical protein